MRFGLCQSSVCSAQQPLKWYRITGLLTCLKITIFYCWPLSNKICLHIPHDDMRYVWLVSAVLSMLSWKDPCVAPCPSPLLFFAGYGKTTKNNINAVGLHLRRTSSKRNNVKLEQVIIPALNHWIISIILFSFPQEPENVQCRLFIKQKSRYRESVGCSHC